ncbi:MAG: phosphonate ABC transporter, permease protein PhnE [Betaproteobacteria bacterium]|nr:phosphonate ABC transporter, permease protein PhnE [Betaproteobacteria bacterium]
MTLAGFTAIRPFRAPWHVRVGWLALFIYLAYATSHLELTWPRFLQGIGNGATFIGRMLPPNFERWELLLKGMAESLEMAVVASFLGIVLSLPLSVLAARNLMPAVVTWPVRMLIMLCRSFHPVIVAIIFVKAVGFGALAGIAALTVASVGFLGKLFAEAIEEISLKQIEAVRATGASFMNTIVFGVIPQVMFRFIGFAAYETDANLRNSTMVGIVGAGGIGGTLFAAFQRFDYDFVFAILLAIIALIMIGEVLQIQIKRVFKQ